MSSDSSCSSPLEHYIGSWRGEVTVEAAGSEPQRYTQQNSFAWILGGRFLEERGIDSNGGSFLGIWSLDPSSGKYRAHYFIAPAGEIVVLTHEWNEQSRTFTGSAELGGGVRMLAEDRFIDSDNYEWRITVLDGKGTALSSMHGLERRVSP
jgi:hypothetical protein